MNKKIFALIFSLIFAVGCKAQIPSNPTTFNCPSVNTDTWTALETPSTEITGLSMTDNTVSQGTWCYAVTAIVNTQTPILQSAPSNVLQVTIPAGLTSQSLVWQAGSGGITPTGYIMYRIAAVQTSLAPPSSLVQ